MANSEMSVAYTSSPASRNVFANMPSAQPISSRRPPAAYRSNERQAARRWSLTRIVDVIITKIVIATNPLIVER